MSNSNNRSKDDPYNRSFSARKELERQNNKNAARQSEEDRRKIARQGIVDQNRKSKTDSKEDRRIQDVEDQSQSKHRYGSYTVGESTEMILPPRIRPDNSYDGYIETPQIDDTEDDSRVNSMIDAATKSMQRTLDQGAELGLLTDGTEQMQIDEETEKRTHEQAKETDRETLRDYARKRQYNTRKNPTV